MNFRKLSSPLIGLLCLAACGADAQPLQYTGTNMSGAEFGPITPGVAPKLAQDYSYPYPKEIDYFASKGMNVFRVPFHWEAMQRPMGGPLVQEELARLKFLVSDITSKGFVAIIDPHNYARYDGFCVSPADLASLWTGLAKEFKGDRRVWFGLMNEPHDMKDQHWLDIANASIAAIRKTGAKNFLLVPGDHWSGAHTWGWSDNATVMLGVKDPLNHWALDVHQYLDSDSSGTSEKIVSPTIGVERIKAVTEWCRKNKRQAFLGEFGTAPTEEAKVAVQNMLRDMEKNRDVWLGFTWWSAGPRWGDYMYAIEPVKGEDRPQLGYLQPHLQKKP
ncbi:glycoside hydrolase family 5 protein [bacterium]|nr:MAG: glycoside hydrolase family 5 protein [bacterium]